MRLPLLVIVTLFAMALGARAESPIQPQCTNTSFPSYYKGINLTWAEYDWQLDPNAVVNQDYTYPPTSELDLVKAEGFTLIRLPFDIERVQPNNMQPLNTTEISYITQEVEYACSIGLYIILDPHSFGYMWSTAQQAYYPIGGVTTPTDYFVDFWTRMAQLYQLYPNVIYGLMNEPWQQDANAWKVSAVAAINGIRSVTTAQIISIPGTCYTGGQDWVSCGNGAAWAGYKDPVGGPFWYEMHRYFDADNSGTYANDSCVAGSGKSMKAAINWLKQEGAYGFVGEFGWPWKTDDSTNNGYPVYTYNENGEINGVANAPLCATVGKTFLTALQNSPNVVGWAWWAGGPWWGLYPLNILSDSGLLAKAPQLMELKPFLH